tara:strand:+ start:10326 stop:11705 length:1380 start_codon:yes stop_codon:yes gene_type:complete
LNKIVVGAYWGDEGKGKIVDLLAADSDWVVRYNGGDNAGHTIVVGDKQVVLHILPSGVLQGKNVAIGPDVFFNPGSFLKDLNHVVESGFKITGRIVIDERAHVIMPYHIKLEGNEKIGTTKRGIGPAAKDKAERTTDITIADMVGENFLERIKEVVSEKKEELIAANILTKTFDDERYCERVHEVYSEYASRIKEYVGETSYLIYEETKKGSVLLEGAQGSLLDVVHGTRPFITSSNTIAGGAASNLGIDLRKFKIIGIVKAYPTRVGEGPFTTELGNYEDAKTEEKMKKLSVEEKRKVIEGDEKLLGRWIRMDGGEYGATTGRPRRTGHPDFVALRYSAMINGIDEWVITKIDVLGGKTFKAAVAYKKDTKITEKFPFRLEGWEPVYSQKEYFWESMTEEQCIQAVTGGYDVLPEKMKQYIRDLVIYTGIPVRMISLSPKREITVVKDVLLRTTEYLK